MDIFIHVFYAYLIINAFILGTVTMEPKIKDESITFKTVVTFFVFFFGIIIGLTQALYNYYKKKLND